MTDLIVIDLLMHEDQTTSPFVVCVCEFLMNSKIRTESNLYHLHKVDYLVELINLHQQTLFLTLSRVLGNVRVFVSCH